MQFAEFGHHQLGTQLQAGRATGAPPGRVLALNDLQRRRAQLVQQRHQVGLELEQWVGGVLHPMLGRMRRQQGGDRRPLVLRLVAPEVGADLEQGGVGEALAGIAGGGLDQIGQGRGPHAVEVGGDGVGQHQRGLAAAEQRGVGGAHEAPADALAIAARRHRAAGVTHAALAKGEHAAGRPDHRRQGVGGQAVIALDPGDLFDQIGLAFHVAAPRRRGDLIAGDREAQAGEDAVDPLCGQVQSGKFAHIGTVEGDRPGW